MVINPFLEKTVRVQTEHGHYVITTAPYAIVRHPMYLGVVLMFMAVPLVLGSAVGTVCGSGMGLAGRVSPRCPA